MKTKYNDGYTEGPKLRGIPVKDFLPKPEDLIFKEPTTKITIVLDSTSVDFFKKEATRLNSSYQRMMRNLLTQYARRMQDRDDQIANE